jgi:hypothetical protein
VFIALAALILCVTVSACAPGGAKSVARASTSQNTPTPATTQGYLASLVRQTLGKSVQHVDVRYDLQTAVVAVTGTLTGAVPRTTDQISAAHRQVQDLCFQVQRALWTSGERLSEVKVTISGPLFDDYSDVITDVYGAAVVKASTAQRMAWQHLNAASAWELYDTVWLRPNYAPNWHYLPSADLTPSPAQP